MKVRISTLTIERFRLLRQLKLEALGRVNLVTGRNNTGKSSILEALRILTSDASPTVLASILRYGEEDMGDGEEPGRPLDAESVSQLGSLFSGFPQISEIREPIVLAANGGQRVMKLTLSVGFFSEERDQEGTRKLVPKQVELFSTGELLPALVIEAGSVRRIIPLEQLRRLYYRGRVLRPDLVEEPRLPCVSFALRDRGTCRQDAPAALVRRCRQQNRCASRLHRTEPAC